MTRLMTIKEVSAHLQVGRGTIYGWIIHKSFPRKKIGHLLRFDLAEVLEWIAQQTLKADNDLRAKQYAHPRLRRHDPNQPVVFTLD